jgi:hypothetical protein
MRRRAREVDGRLDQAPRAQGYHEHRRRAAEERDVREAPQRIERHRRHRRGDDVRRDARHDEGVAVGSAPGDELRADVAAGARPVLHHHVLPEPASELVGRDAGERVGAAARGERRDDLHRARRPVLAVRRKHRAEHAQ